MYSTRKAPSRPVSPPSRIFRFASGTGTTSPHSGEALDAAVQPGGGGDELGGIGQVRRAALVDVDRQVRPATHERARRARVVEVDMRQEQALRALAADRGEQRLLARLRARVDQPAVDLPAADDVLVAEVHDVDGSHALRRYPHGAPSRTPGPSLDDADLRRPLDRADGPTSSTGATWPRGRPGSPSPSTCRRRPATTPTTSSRAARSARSACRSRTRATCTR